MLQPAKTSFINKIAPLILLVLLLFSFWMGYRGIDFGYHWDEADLINTVFHFVQKGTLLPGWYSRPSLTCYITASGILPEWLSGKLDKDNLLLMISRHEFKLRVRLIYLAITLLSMLWTYLLVCMWKRSRFEALLAAAILGFSWEVAYHARWIAPDGVMLQFVALTMLLVVAALVKENRKSWLRLASVAAGFATGTKYPSGVILLPILIALFTSSGKKTDKMSEAAVILIVFTLSFCLSTPGAIFEPGKFVTSVAYQMEHYKSGHWGYTVKPYFEHTWLLLKYFVLAFFSHYKFISIALSITALLGAYSIFRHNRRDALIFISVPVLYYIYFSTQKVMIVRNMLLMAPFLSVFSARGAVYIADMFKKGVLRYSVGAIFVFFMLANASWLYKTADSIRNAPRKPCNDNITDYVKAVKSKVFLYGSIAKTVELGSFSNVAVDRSQAEEFVFSTSDVDWRKLTANRYGMYRVICGPYEVNVDYYPTWLGSEKVLSVPMKEISLMESTVYPPQPPNQENLTFN